MISEETETNWNLWVQIKTKCQKILKNVSMEIKETIEAKSKTVLTENEESGAQIGGNLNLILSQLKTENTEFPKKKLKKNLPFKSYDAAMKVQRQLDDGTYVCFIDRVLCKVEKKDSLCITRVNSKWYVYFDRHLHSHKDSRTLTVCTCIVIRAVIC